MVGLLIRPAVLTGEAEDDGGGVAARDLGKTKLIPRHSIVEMKSATTAARRELAAGEDVMF